MKKAPMVLAALLGLSAAAWGRSPVSLGQTPEQVRAELGKPHQKIVQITQQQDLEIWSYRRSYRIFWMGDDCPDDYSYVPQPMSGAPQETGPLRCDEKARVIFVDGKVIGFLERD